MTATAPAAPQPTAEQLKAYADQLPELYREVLAAIRAVNPHRRVGEGVFPSQIRNHLSNEYERSERRWGLNDAGGAYPLKVGALTDIEFEQLLDTLAVNGFIHDPLDTRLGRLIPTDLGEQLISILTGVPPRRVELPPLPKPTW